MAFYGIVFVARPCTMKINFPILVYIIDGNRIGIAVVTGQSKNAGGAGTQDFYGFIVFQLLSGTSHTAEHRESSFG